MTKSRARVFADFVSGNNVAQLEAIASQANTLVLSIQEKLEVANAEALFVSNTAFQSFAANTNAYINAIGGVQNIQLVQTGTLGTTKGAARWYSPSNTTVTKVTAFVADQPEGQPITVVINSSDTKKQELRIAPNTSTITNTTQFDVDQYEFLTVDIDSVGTRATGKDLNVQVFYTQR
jgi:hypothetical protein